MKQELVKILTTTVFGLALKGTDAAKIQDDFAEYIIKTLTTYFNVKVQEFI